MEHLETQSPLGREEPTPPPPPTEGLVSRLKTIGQEKSGQVSWMVLTMVLTRPPGRPVKDTVAEESTHTHTHGCPNTPGQMFGFLMGW